MGAEHGAERTIERTFAQESVDWTPKWAQEQLLNHASAMGFGEQTPVQKTDRKPATRASPFVLPGEQLLGDRVAIIVSEDVKRIELAIVDERLAEVGLLHDAVTMRVWLVAESEAEEIHRDQAIRHSEIVPDGGPVPGRSGKPMNEKDRGFVEVPGVAAEQSSTHQLRDVSALEPCPGGELHPRQRTRHSSD